MRKIDLSVQVTINGQPYTAGNLLKEFVWSDSSWSIDEGTVAAFNRCIAALPKSAATPDGGGNTANFEEEDFMRVCQVLRSLTGRFPAHCSIELAHLRNSIVLTPKEKSS
jgi:hypothetical protein